MQVAEGFCGERIDVDGDGGETEQAERVLKCFRVLGPSSLKRRTHDVTRFGTVTRDVIRRPAPRKTSESSYILSLEWIRACIPLSL